jgi:hypothetical protein
MASKTVFRMSHRTYGETKNCKGCRYWSEMIARSIGGGPVQAMCLSGGPLDGKDVCGHQTCSAWTSGHHGAIDEPPDYGAEVRALYAQEDGA